MQERDITGAMDISNANQPFVLQLCEVASISSQD